MEQELKAVAMPPPLAEATEIKDFVDKAQKRATGAKHETFYINGLAVGEVRLYKVAQLVKSDGHKGHKHDEGYARLEMVMKCMKCGKEVPYAEQIRVKGKKDDESPFWVDASPAGEVQTKQSGVYVVGQFNGTVGFEDVVEAFRIYPEHYKAKRDAKKQERNTSIVNAVCWNSDPSNNIGATKGYGLLCEYRGRPAVWAGSNLYVLHLDSEYNNIPGQHKYGETHDEGVEMALTSLKMKAPQELELCAELV